MAGALAWGTLTTLWLTAAIPVPKQLVGIIGTRSSLFQTAETQRKVQPASQVAAPQPAPELKPVNSAVYRASAEQLVQDYDANEVAIQSKIGDSPIRVSGSVAQINEDTAGHPVVTLHAGRDNADMLLTDDQKPAAAQLSKEDSVEIQCNKMQRIAARLRGSGCALMLVDSGKVYLAVSLSGKAGSTPLYIVGPMSQQSCLASSDTIAMQVASNPRSDRILSKSCAATARESVPVEGCRLSSTMSAIPDLPAAHLWKYDCTASAETPRVAETPTSRRTLLHVAAPAAPAAIDALSQTTPAPADTSSDSVATASKAALEAAPSVAAATLADDLVAVRTKDPDAADRIASYCNKITSGAPNLTTVVARCRREEMDAWTRLVDQNEFPNLDDTSRRKCNEPPFPDSFVARESCAKYQLHLD